MIPSPITDLTQARLRDKRAKYLARTRTQVPERRDIVRHANGTIWKQDTAHLAEVLKVKAKREMAG
jgi:hypothetical protein